MIGTMRFFRNRVGDVKDRRKALRGRAVFYGSVLALLVGGYHWQPVRYDWIPRKLPATNPKVDPDSARLFAKGTRIAVVVAHPDDSEYYLAPLLLKLAEAGAELHHILITEGDKGFYFWTNAEETRRIRREEQRAASEGWKARSLMYLGLPDGRLDSDAALNPLRAELERIRPEYVLSFDPEFPPRASHGDHRSAGRATVAAAASVDSVRWVLHYSTMAPNHSVEVSKKVGEGLELLALHKSQWTGEKLERVRDTVLGSWAEAGPLADSDYGVALRCVRIRRD